MGNKPCIPLAEEEIVELQNQTGFSRSQLKSMYSRFLHLCGDGKDEVIRRSDLLRLSDLKSNPLGSRVVDAFFKDACSDDETMDFIQFVKAAAIFRPQSKHTTESALNSTENKLKFVFEIYDLDGNAAISHEEMLSLLKMMVGPEVNDETLSQIAERAVREGDLDEDGYISFSDFKKALMRTEAENKVSIRFLD